MSRSIVGLVEPMARQIGRNLGLDIVDVQFVKAGGRQLLRVLIDKPGGVGLDDCQRFSEPFSRALDEADPIPDHYYLEVSSPGPDRPLKTDLDFERFAGSAVDVSLAQPIEGRRKLHGILVGLEGDSIIVQTTQQQLRIPRGTVRWVRLSPDDDLGGGGTRK